MRKTSGFVCGLVLASAWAAQARGQVVETPAPAGTTTTTAVPADAAATGGMRRVSQILGSTVRLQGTDNFGRVDDIVLDDNGGVGYLVVSAPNNRNVMLPWNAGQWNWGQRVVSYDVTPQAVQPLFFERNAFPNVYAAPYTTRVQQVFPNAGVIRRDVLRPVPGAVPPGAPAVIEQRTKVNRRGDVQVKERIR